MNSKRKKENPMNSNIKQHSPSNQSDLLVALLFTVPIFLPLIKQQFFWSHENAYFLWRMASFHQNVINGMPFCRWFPDFARGFGLPFLEFYPVLPLYLGELFRIVGIPIITTVKLIIVIMSLFATAGAWRLGHAVWGRSGGMVTAILYTYAPYKLLNLYVRGDINEYMAMAGLPWCLYLIYRAAETRKLRPYSLVTIAALAIPALSHYPSCVIQYPVITGWILCLALSSEKPRRFLVHSFANLAAALLVTSPFWVSAFASRHLVQMEGMTKGFADYTQHFIYPWQWFSFYWNFGASVNGPGDAISFQLGNYALIAALLGGGAIAQLLLKHTLKARAVQFSILISIIVVFLTHSSSHFIWKTIPVMPMLQFPYRLLAIPALLLAVLGGAVSTLLARLPGPHRRYPATLLLATLIVIASMYMCRVAEYMNLAAEDLDSQDIQLAAHTHCTGEYIPRPVGKRFPPPKPFTFTLEKIPEKGFTRQQTEERLDRWLKNASNIETWEGGQIPIGPVTVWPGKLDVVTGTVKLITETGHPVNRSWEYNAPSPAKLRLNQFYFEGWFATIDGTHHQISPDPDTGLIHIDIPPGTHTLNIKYRNLPLSRKLSWLSLLIICALVMTRYTILRNNENVV